MKLIIHLNVIFSHKTCISHDPKFFDVASSLVTECRGLIIVMEAQLWLVLYLLACLCLCFWTIFRLELENVDGTCRRGSKTWFVDKVVAFWPWIRFRWRWRSWYSWEDTIYGFFWWTWREKCSVWHYNMTLYIIASGFSLGNWNTYICRCEDMCLKRKFHHANFTLLQMK